MKERLAVLKSIVEHGKRYYRESFTKDTNFFKFHQYNAQHAKRAIDIMCKQYFISEPLRARLLEYAWDRA